MAIKLTKNELKTQKDALKRYTRYLPTLTLKKQQLQSEIRDIEICVKELWKV
jgi:V/A-type H+-transporting ATPase subunit D